MTTLLRRMTTLAASALVLAAAVLQPQPASAQWQWDAAAQVWVDVQSASVDLCARYCGVPPTTIANSAARTYANLPTYGRWVAAAGGPLRYQTTPQYVYPQVRVQPAYPRYYSSPPVVYYIRR